MDYDPRLEAVADRYVTPFYLDMLHGNVRRLAPRAQANWVRRLHASAEALDEQTAGWFLDFREWRGRMAASWMIGLRGWDSFAEQIGRQLVESELVYAGQGYCVGLALLGTSRAADMLVAYLNEWLPRTDCRYDQDWAMAALIEIDGRCDTERARPYLVPDGQWDEWRNTNPASPIALAPVRELLDLLATS